MLLKINCITKGDLSMSKLSKKKVIGITGSMGSGKSEISRYLRKNILF